MQKYVLYTRKGIKKDEDPVDWGKLSQQYGVKILYAGDRIATVLMNNNKLRTLLSDHPELKTMKISKQTN